MNWFRKIGLAAQTHRNRLLILLMAWCAVLLPAWDRHRLRADPIRPKPAGQNPLAGVKAPTQLLIIAPASFASVLHPLLKHKNAIGTRAVLLTVEQIRAHFPGRDDPERIKRAIAYAHEHLRTRYIMLAGDASLIPVRYRFVREADDPKVGAWAGWHDGSYVASDLYYANLYCRRTQGGRVFATWDANGNRKYNEQQWGPAPLARTYNPDGVDGFPDVAVGRVPAHTPAEMKTYADKVIRYETDRANPATNGYYTFLEDKNYAGAVSMSQDVIKVVLPGAGRISRVGVNYGRGDVLPRGWRRGNFRSIEAAVASGWWISYIGHGFPQGWAVGNSQGSGPLQGNYDSKQVRLLRNQSSLPIVYAAACETGQFATGGPFGRYRGLSGEAHWLWYYVDQKRAEDKETGQKLRLPVRVPPPHPYDFPESRDRTVACAWLVGPHGGGAIAYFGEMVVKENDKGKDLERRVLECYARGDRVLGEMWLKGQQRYWKDFVGCGDVFREPRIYLGIMTLFGDPSLRLKPRHIGVGGGGSVGPRR